MDLKESYREKVKEQLASTVDQLVDSGEVTDFSPAAAQNTVASVARAMMQNARRNERFGTFYTTQRVRELLGGVTRQAVSDRVLGRRLLRVTTADGVQVYPAFQFTQDPPGVRRELIPLLKTLLSSGVDSWTAVYWLTAKMPEFGNRTALEVAREGGGTLSQLEDMAKEDAQRWISAGYGRVAS